MEYSIVIPVFNKADLTAHCLRTLRQTLHGAGDGEVIVVDNGSTDHTAAVLAEFPWITVLRNGNNRGFAAACNQGAAAAHGRFVVHLNNDTEAKPGWLAAMLDAAREPGVGAVGARLLFGDGTLQHAGVYTVPLRMGQIGFSAYHYLNPHAPLSGVRDLQVVTAACMVTPRELFEKLGGFDEMFWNGNEDVDYCLRLRAAGYRVVYQPQAVLLHFESQSGVQRTRRLSANLQLMGDRWRGHVRYDQNDIHLADGAIRREVRLPNAGHTMLTMPAPATTIFVHGEAAADRKTFEAQLRANHAPIERIVWHAGANTIEAARSVMEVRGDRYVALVDAGARLHAGWLDELVRQIEWGHGICAAAYSPHLPSGEDVATLAAGAGCTLLALREFPQHVRLEAMDSLDGALADLLIRMTALRRGTRATAFAVAEVPELASDAAFDAAHGMALRDAVNADPRAIERGLRAVPKADPSALASIVMLSWNAPQYTKLALESIRTYTNGTHPYEIVIVDNGSGPETTDWLRSLDDVRVIFNDRNRGYAGGNNQGIAAARGKYVVLLNNDVVVTEGWLDGLIAGLERNPGTGVSGPRSNRVAGDQQVVDASYQDIPGMHAYAQERRRKYARTGYMSDRIIGLCLCIDRTVIDEVGGIDERYAVGNFEDDDFSMRVRSAGYKMYVCDDVFIHHFGSQSFAANKVDWNATMQSNWSIFAAKWGLPPAYPVNGYQTRTIIARGFDASRHHVEVAPAEPVGAEAMFVFVAAVDSEKQWDDVGNFLKKFIATFDAREGVWLCIGAFGEMSADVLAARVEKAVTRSGRTPGDVPEIHISDEDDAAAWLADLPAVPMRRLTAFGAPPYAAVELLEGRSPSVLRRLVETTVQPA